MVNNILMYIILLIINSACQTSVDRDEQMFLRKKAVYSKYENRVGRYNLKYKQLKPGNNICPFSREYMHLLDNDYSEKSLIKILDERESTKTVFDIANVEEYAVRLSSYLNITKVKLSHNVDKINTYIDSLPITTPMHGYVTTSTYGLRRHPRIKRVRKHLGVDIASMRDEVYSTADGVVVFAGKKNGYGNTVIIKHSSRVKTLYAHLKQIYVAKNNKVRRFQKIGVQGKTGSATNKHLHYEVMIDDRKINPDRFLKIAEQCKW